VGQFAAGVNQGASQLAAGLGTAAQRTTEITHAAGQLAQAAGQAANALQLAMANVAKQPGAAVGGAECGDYFGGDLAEDPAKTLREYEHSLAAQAKERVVRGLARALVQLGVKTDPDGDLEEVTAALLAQVPNPKAGKTFAVDAAKQAKICKGIADALNAEFSPGATKPSDKFIDTSLGNEAICRSTGEWVHSFASGVNTEFLAVHASVRKLLAGIQVLDQVMSTAWAKVQDKIAKGSDDQLRREIESMTELYARAQSERRRQEELLKNILNVQLAPAEKELEIALRDESEQNALIKRLGLQPGSKEFSDSLAMAVSGLGTAASVAHRVNKALKQVGFSVRQYLDSRDFKDFQRDLDDKLESGTVTADEFAKFLQAMEVLRYAFGERDNSAFRDALESEGTTGAGEKRRRAKKRGGADGDTAAEPPSAIGRRVELRETEKRVIVRDFALRMTRHYDELLAAVKALGPELGKRIPLSDRTDALRDALARLRDMRANSQRIELSLIGMYIDAEARERKESFVNTLRVVSASCASIMELDAYRDAAPFFARLKAAIDSIEKTIDQFSDVITKKYGGEPAFGEDEASAMYEGGAGADVALPEVARSGLSLGTAVSEFAYFYYVAKVRANLASTSKELDAYGDKYAELLGDAVASRLYNLEQERKTILGRLADTNRATVIAAVGGAAPAGDQAAQQKLLVAARKWVTDEYNAKAQFYRALQAMDLYMKAFTAAIVKDPDSVRDIKQALDGTQVIARWFSEQTGDAIWKAFENMGATDFAGTVTLPVAGEAVLADTANAAYYEKVGASAGPTLGVPEIGVLPDTTKADAARKSVGDALDHFQAFKNLVNAFARIGDKFGGRELRAQIFMSPAQIYKALMDYLKQSAMSINASGADASAVPATRALQLFGVRAGALPNVANAVTPYQVYFGSVGKDLAGNYEIEDRYFTLIVKAMAAKVFTTLGVFDMFERNTPLYDLTPTRMIVGGADFDEVPEVIEGAAELYFRLVRLGEFYRGFLRWDGVDDAKDAFRIAMLPELEGVFAGFIRLIFQKAATSSLSGEYSDSEMRALVREVNAVYEHFREKQNGGSATSAAISAFVAEVNRRYGVIKRQDMQDYMKLVKISRTGQYGELNDTDYAILPGEGEAEFNRRAPSDTFAVPGSAPDLPKPFAGRTGLDTAWDKEGARAMLRNFRDRLDKQFASVDTSRFGKTSYSLLIKQAESEIVRAQSRDAKFAVAVKLIQGTSVVGTDSNKAFMFHETVVVGLNLLNGIQSFLSKFDAQVNSMNPRVIEEAIMDAVHATAPAAASKAWLLSLFPASSNYARYIVDEAAGSFLGRSGTDATVTATDIYNLLATFRAGMPAGALGGKKPSDLRDSVAASDADLQAAGAPLVAGSAGYLRGLRVVARLLTNYGLIMRDYIENVFDLSSANAVEARLSGGVQLSFAKLRGLAESLMVDVKMFFELFRPFLNKTTIERFESLGSPGSIFWLEKNLVDVFFRGTDDDNSSNMVLDGLARRAGKVFDDLTRKTQVSLSAVTAGNVALGLAIAPPPVDDESRYENYGAELSEIVFYNAVDSESRQTGLGGAQVLASSGFDMSNLIASARAGAPAAAPTAAARFALYGSAAGMTRYRSLLFAYNQLIAYFLTTLSDKAAGYRIYGNLINSFANGVASRSVMNPSGSAFPDLTAVGETFGRRGDPKAEAVLCSSLAWVLQRLIKDVNPNNQISDHLVATLTDVPLYVKEAMRANLPGFIKLFDLLTQKGDFVKQLMQKTNIRAGRASQLVGAGAGDKIVTPAGARSDAAPAPYLPGALAALEALAGPMTSEQMKTRLAGVIDALASGAYTLSNASAEVLKELGDSPVYLQTGEGAIENYKMRYGKIPLMPLSLAMWYLGNVAVSDTKLLPVHSMGTPEFKMMYGTRGIIPRSTAVSFEQMPSVKASLDAYNGVSAKREQVEPARYAKFVQAAVTALRYFTEARSYKSMLSTSNTLFSGGALVNHSPVYSLTVSAQEVLAVAESSNQEEEATKIANLVGGSMDTPAGSGGREMERILSLVDMNIIPVNVHALMRDIPLANLYNYEYTFEQMIASMYGEQAASYASIDDASTRNTRQMFLRLMMDPYMPVSAGMYGSDTTDSGSAGFVQRIFRGDNGLGMGRPKFLSDQLFNKALFGSIYQSQRDFDEAGPATGIGMPRGVAAVNLVTAPRQTVSRRDVITYLESSSDPARPESVVKEVNVTEGRKQQLGVIGKARFDTRFVRNIFFITNVVRLLRLKLSRELTQSRNVIESSHMAVASGITEYGADPFGPNEVLASRLPNGMPRFNDRDDY
jgi:hypothetical protein